MEQLLHYVWQHKLYISPFLTTTEGEGIEVIDPGLHNTDAGPDFFNAKIKINGIVWVGNVEIHTVSSDWMRHGHHQDANYDNVILHVVEKADSMVFTQSGKKIPQTELHIPQQLEENYQTLLKENAYPPCWKIIPKLPFPVINQWLDTLSIERLEQKAERIRKYTENDLGNWERAFFITLARNFGFGINSDAFEEWALHIPLQACGKHRDNIFQIEALFLGQAGLLEEHLVPSYHRENAKKDGYFQKLLCEYQFLSKKFSLTPMSGHRWRFLRLRPQNFPHIRLVQLAQLYCSGKLNLSTATSIDSLEKARSLFASSATPYWQTHYVFGGESAFSEKNLQKSSIDLLVINTVIPILFAYGKHRGNSLLCQKGLELLELIPAENNRFTRIWANIGLPVKTASDSQALIQLQTHYCNKKDCLRCRFGYFYLKQKNNK